MSRPNLIALAIALVMSVPLPAAAQGARARDIQVAPNCVIHIEVPPPLTAQKTADLDAVVAAINAALQASADMRTKVADACAQNRGTINIVPLRDSSSVFIGKALLNTSPRVAVVDLGDIETAGMFLSGGTAADRQQVADGMLTRFLAHEIDHLRDRPRERHLDPQPRNAHRERGAGVDDANRVLDETGNDTFRQQYAQGTRIGGRRTIITTFRVNGRVVTWDSGAHQRFVRQARTQRGASRSRAVLEDPFATFAHPNRPCEDEEDPHAGGCWPRLILLDQDLDTVPDEIDNCVHGWNPQQGDGDDDGVGDACADDADGDGFGGPFEGGVGSSDMSSESTPESWAVGGTCADGVDNDGDGNVDAADESCLTPRLFAGGPDTFPDALSPGSSRPTERGAPIPGSLPFEVTCGITLTNPDGERVDSQLVGTAVIAPPLVPTKEDLGGTQLFDLPGMRLTGELPDGELIQIRPQPNQPPFGQIVPLDPEQPGPLPGDLSATFFLEIDIGADLQLFNHEPISPPPLPMTDFPTGLLIPPDPTLGGVELHTQALVTQKRARPVQPRGDTLSGWTVESFSFNAEPVTVPLAGAGRIETAAAVAETFPSADTVLIARADDYPDALAGAPLAAALGAPVLLTAIDGLSGATAEQVARLGATTAIVLGGESAVGPGVADDLAAVGVTVERLAGASRFHTAGLIAERLATELGVTELPRAYVAEGIDSDPTRGWPDALSVSWLAAAQGRPVLMVSTDELPAATAETIAGLNISDVTIVGGPAAVSEDVEAEIGVTGATVERIFGPSRYATSAAVVRRAIDDGAAADAVWLATGLSFPDALVAGPAAGGNGALLVLVDGGSVDASPDTRDLLAGLGDRRTTVFLGGEAAISQTVREQVAALG